MPKQDQEITFSSTLPVADLTDKNIKAISHYIAQVLAANAATAMKAGKGETSLAVQLEHIKHISSGGGEHSRWLGGGSLKGPNL